MPASSKPKSAATKPKAASTHKQDKTYNISRRVKTGPEELPLPSGNTCLVKRPDPMDLISVGILDKFDSLTAMVQMEHFDRVDGKETPEQAQENTIAQMQALASNKDAFKDMLSMLDKMVTITVVEPNLTAPPEDDADRISGVFYADEVDLEDRVCILNYAMKGVQDLEPFRS